MSPYIGVDINVVYFPTFLSVTVTKTYIMILLCFMLQTLLSNNESTHSINTIFYMIKDENNL